MNEDSYNIIYISNEDKFIFQLQELGKGWNQPIPETEINQKEEKKGVKFGNPFTYNNINQTAQKIRKIKSLKIEKKKQKTLNPKCKSTNHLKRLNVI